MLARHMLYPRYRYGVSAKWLKSLALNTVLGGLKAFTGEINIIIVAFVLIMNELHTQEEAKRLSNELSLKPWKGVGTVQPKSSGDAEIIAVQPRESTQAGLWVLWAGSPELGACGHPWPHLVGGRGLWWY